MSFEMNDNSTQLADSRPQFDAPLRIAIPVNAPPRAKKYSRDMHIRSNSFSPAALTATKEVIEAVCRGAKLATKKHNSIPPINMDHDAQIKTAIRDFSVVAFSSKRAGKKDIEASSYVSLGIIHDNQEDYKKAIEQYLLYLQICEEIGDVVGSACACNCLGVDFMLLASPPSDAGTVCGVISAPTTIEYLNRAVYYNSKHLDIGPDNGGRFVASTNLGLCFGMIGDVIQSAKQHQDALRTAIVMQTLYGQSIAVGNLGLLALTKRDYPTARTCFDQHLQLVQALLDSEAEVNAWKMLAKICEAQGKYADALENLEQARKIAEREGYMNELRRIHCLIGLSKGSMTFGSHVDSILTELGVKVI